jgi:hypothetical protein
VYGTFSCRPFLVSAAGLAEVGLAVAVGLGEGEVADGVGVAVAVLDAAEVVVGTLGRAGSGTGVVPQPVRISTAASAMALLGRITAGRAN